MIMVGMAIKNNLAKDKLEHINSVPRPTTPPFCSYLFFNSEIKITLKTIYYSFHKFIDGLLSMLRKYCVIQTHLVTNVNCVQYCNHTV